MYAVIEACGKQVKVSPGDKISIDNVCGEKDSEIVFGNVLAISKDNGIVFGKPYIDGASVKAEIIGKGKMDKVLILRPRPKKAIRRLKGHRQHYTLLKIKEIIGG